MQASQDARAGTIETASRTTSTWPKQDAPVEKELTNIEVFYAWLASFVSLLQSKYSEASFGK
jgi:hypothetical protein